MKYLRHNRAMRALPFFLSLSAVAATVCIIPNLKHFVDKSGAIATFSNSGHIDENNAFFQSLGTNGRTCATCHQPDQAFGLSAKGAEAAYERMNGNDPLFVSVVHPFEMNARICRRKVASGRMLTWSSAYSTRHPAS